MKPRRPESPGPGTVCIYQLIDPIDHTVRYVGRTGTLPQIRLAQHVADAVRRDADSPKNEWIISLALQNMMPRIRVVGMIPRVIAKEVERATMVESLQDGHVLYNNDAHFKWVKSEWEAGRLPAYYMTEDHE